MINIKVIHNASQALIYKFKNTKTKTQKCTANILYFNRECLKHNLLTCLIVLLEKALWWHISAETGSVYGF
jgi:hypothetical protein